METTEDSYSRLVPTQAQFSSAKDEFVHSNYMFEQMTTRVSESDDEFGLIYFGIDDEVEDLLYQNACDEIENCRS
ncbi:MAG: hypothetical protein V2I33_19465 [Kangiellaceae bacterium]|nr:hypothetical protein [Kangiellaceae bacterium]